MCGLLAYLSTDAERVDEQTVSGVQHALQLPAAPRARRPGALVRPRTPSSGSTGWR